MTVLLVCYFSILFFILTALLLLSLKDRPRTYTQQIKFPRVSVLLAARNEEKNITGCLQALAGLNYPEEKLEILIGNDASEDATRRLAEEFAEGKPQFRIYDILENTGNARGKANVLAHLAKKAQGEYFFITDADIRVPSTWIQGLLEHMDEQTGIVSGVTVTESRTLSGKLQALEWIQAFGMITTVTELGIPVTAVGNNMVISRRAYGSTGGYEKIPFSVTEDFELFRQTLKKGWRFKNLINPEVLAWSMPAPGLSALMKQRKRWMKGAVQLPPLLVFVLLVQALFFPLIITTLALFPVWGALLWMGKILLQQLITALTMRKINIRSGLLKYFLIYELYAGLLSFAMVIYHILPFRVEWKGRKY